MGSITALTNTSGTIVQTYTYDSFGNITSTGSINQPFTYTAREYDAETGMYFYRARYYDPKIGRFVTKDPIGFESGINHYIYVGNNPVNLRDPSGLKPSYLCKLQCDFYRFADILGCNMNWHTEDRGCFDDNALVTPDCMDKAKKRAENCLLWAEEYYKRCLKDCPCE